MTLPLTNALAMRTAAISARWEDHVADNSPKYLTDWQRGLVAGQQAMRTATPAPSDKIADTPQGMTASEIAAALELTVIQVRPRLSELKKGKLIAPSPFRSQTGIGQCWHENVWLAPPKKEPRNAL